MTGYSIQRSPNRKIRRPGETRLGWPLMPAIYCRSPFFGSFVPTLCPSKLVPGNEATKAAAAPATVIITERSRSGHLSNPLLRHIAPNGNRDSMNREHKQKLQHSRATHRPTARPDGSRKKGEMESRHAHTTPTRLPFHTARHHRAQGKWV